MFVEAAPPKQTRSSREYKPVLSDKDAKALADTLTKLETTKQPFVRDETEYKDRSTANNQVGRYRKTLDHYGMIPEGKKLSSRVALSDKAKEGADGPVILYLRFRDETATSETAND